MNSLHRELDSYLAQRRALGFKLTTSEYLLRQFLAWLETQGGCDSFTVDDAISWAREPKLAAPVWWSQRLTAIRPFAAWLNANGLGIPVIPSGLLPVRSTRRVPFIYSQRDLDRILTACPLFFTNRRVAATMVMIIGLLAVTGLRIGEALRLEVPDLEVGEDLLLVRATKKPLDRLVPLDPSTTSALVEYLALPERVATRPSPVGPIFVNYRGKGFTTASIEQYFRALVAALGLVQDGQPSPRLHDLRHTFATRHMIAAYRNGTDPARTLGLLSTWLGHTGPEHTYWYLSAVPELLAAAAGRLEPTLEEGTES